MGYGRRKGGLKSAPKTILTDELSVEADRRGRPVRLVSSRTRLQYERQDRSGRKGLALRRGGELLLVRGQVRGMLGGQARPATTPRVWSHAARTLTAIGLCMGHSIAALRALKSSLQATAGGKGACKCL